MGFTKEKMLITVKRFWVKSRDAQPRSCWVSEAGCSTLLGEAVQTGLTCSAIEKRNHTVLKVFVVLWFFFFFLLGAQWEIKSAPYREKKMKLL